MSRDFSSNEYGYHGIDTKGEICAGDADFHLHQLASQVDDSRYTKNGRGCCTKLAAAQEEPAMLLRRAGAWRRPDQTEPVCRCASDRQRSI